MITGTLKKLKRISCNIKKSMNEILNKLLLATDKFMPEMHLRHPRFMYIAYETFIRNK